jgi:hypothetical protein
MFVTPGGANSDVQTGWRFGLARLTSQSAKACDQRCIGHAAPIPNGVDEVVFADDTLPITDQVIQQVEYLWCDGDNVRPAMQLAPASVEYVLLEKVAQAANPLSDL